MKEVLTIRGLALGMHLMNAWARLRHRLSGLSGPRIRGLDHITLPCRDLAAAEAFYTGVLGARVLMRVDAEMLRRRGRSAEDAAQGTHTSLVFSGGARLDLFQGTGQPPPLAGHPHYAMAISPGEMLKWKQRLADHRVPTYGPTRLGPPGQASLYFNDPSGNHLELVTLGYTGEIPVGPPDMSALAYEWSGP